MRKILNLIDLIKTSSILDNFSLIGNLKKQVGNHFFLNPSDAYFQAISLLKINDKVKKIGVLLSEEIDLIQIENILCTKAEETYSSYDDISYYNFYTINKCKISFIYRGISKDILCFKELEISFE